VVGKFALIHSVDSLRLAEEISSAAQKQGVVQPVLLQAKMAEDPSKSGFSPDELKDHFARLLQLPGIEIRGLMTMTPMTDDRQVWNQCFNGLRQLRDELEQAHNVKLE